MDIDLREIQALHARFAREPVVIDLEAQVLSRPAPLLLAHNPVSTTSPLRRVWRRRASVGRGALMAVGGTVLCAATGMGIAKLYGVVRSGQPAAVHVVPTVTAATPAAASGAQAATPPASTALTSDDFDRSSARGNALSAVDPASLVRQTAPGVAVAVAAAAAGRSVNDDVRAAASPIQQRRIQQTAAPAGAQPTPAPAAADAKPQPQAAVTANAGTAVTPQQDSVSPPSQAARPTHHTARRRVTPARETPPSAADAKPVPPAARGGDVQLF
ncbi:hypothetical protein M3A49_39360 [Paraburkholderia sp. CNPSo 3076]|uniref:hypothetical protein n=1 Tax=Paraburkholderia sp. CNPSo 3076 TaxID=2940936 RepID=UPI00225563A3|nr:hypothetical protein [Paraburkholderia sp. CNPSo 3076]MCX5545420.1 hypothetical protein [Paraburkholderia sp. CNPSo 3076]